MMYLKRFNENISDWDLNLIRKFCYQNLAYLLDEGADLDFSQEYRTEQMVKVPYYKVIIKNINSKWSDIEVDMCPFLELLEEKYDLLNIYNNNQIEIMSKEALGKIKATQYTGKIWFSINEIISGCIDDNSEISSISFLIRL